MKHRSIDSIILHCSATRPCFYQGEDDIRDWHVKRGWKREGYHYLVTRGADIETGRPVSMIGAHARGYNKTSIGVCIAGGSGASAKDPWQKHFIEGQMFSTYLLVSGLLTAYPAARVAGHNEFAAKGCPGFEVPQSFMETLRTQLGLS